MGTRRHLACILVPYMADFDIRIISIISMAISVRHWFSKQALVKKACEKFRFVLLRSHFSSLSTQQKWTVEERNKTSKISPSFCTKKHLNPFSSLGERVVWSCVDGFKKVPKPKTHTSGLITVYINVGLFSWIIQIWIFQGVWIIQMWIFQGVWIIQMWIFQQVWIIQTRESE